MTTRIYIAAFTILTLGQAQANEASSEIQRFANEICGPELAPRSDASSLELGVNAETKLSTLLGKLTALSVGGSAKLKQEKTSGVLQKDLASEISSRRNCKYKVFDRLSADLNIFSPSTIEFKKVFTVDLPPPKKPITPNTTFEDQIRDPRSSNEKCEDSSIRYNGLSLCLIRVTHSAGSEIANIRVQYSGENSNVSLDVEDGGAVSLRTYACKKIEVTGVKGTYERKRCGLRLSLPSYTFKTLPSPPEPPSRCSASFEVTAVCRAFSN